MARIWRVGGVVAGLVLALVLVGPPRAGGELVVLVSAESQLIATDIVNGTVSAVATVETGSQVRTVATVEVDELLRGSLSGPVTVEVLGGRAASGIDVIVSHQPALRAGDRLQLALLPARAEVAAAVGNGTAVYSVAGGIDGAVSLDGAPLSQADAAGDYLFHGATWAGFPVDYVINPTGSTLTATETISALRAGVQSWIDDPGSDTGFTYGGTTSASPLSWFDGVNTIGWVDTPDAADTYLARAVWTKNGSTTVGFDIQFNRDHLWAVGASVGRYDVATVNRHEIGHVLGLSHTTTVPGPAELMHFRVASNFVKVLGAGDRAGIGVLYPATGGATACDGLTVTIDMNTNGGDGIGTAGDDVILGTPGADVIIGSGGNDTICGQDGDDVIWGGDGADRLFGQGGNDTILAEAGNDRVDGGPGNDNLYGYDGLDVLDGGPGNDILQGMAGDDELFGGPGVDGMHGQAGDDKMFGGTEADYLWGYDGNDTMVGDGGDDVLQGMAGNDRLEGGPGVDTLIGGADGDLLYGQGDVDVLWGLEGNDWLDGGTGNDVVLGGPGVDTLVGGEGIDNLLGDAGNDTIHGQGGIDLLWGGDGDDVLYGGADHDIVQGDAGADELHGELGNDTILGGPGADWLLGGDGADVLWGLGDNDTISGGPGNDTLLGGTGIDACSGGAGVDANADCESFTQ